MPKVIGLTGNIACGKSTVAAILSELGAEVIDADVVARQVMTAPGSVFASIVREFGREVVAPNGQIDRPKLGAIVFSDPVALHRLDQLVHPATSATIRGLLAESSRPIVVVEAIKLIEAGTDRACTEVWIVNCQREQQVERLVGLRGLPDAEAERRIAAQAPIRDKLARADVVIDTSGSLADTRYQVVREWERFTGRPQLPSP
jgi:dephospho-CoA kinase